MPTSSAPCVLLFSYGTLQDQDVQIANFGRTLAGRQDALPGYIRRTELDLLNAVPSSNPGDAVLGIVFEITAEELAAADKYEETDAYRRVIVKLKSGDQAWVYLRD